MAQGSILSISDLFVSIEKAFVHNFVDYNSLSAWSRKLSDLIGILESESCLAIDSFTKDKLIIVNLKSF